MEIKCQSLLMQKSFVFLRVFQELGKGFFGSVEDSGKQPQVIDLYLALCI